MQINENKKILVVDDSAVVRGMLQRHLRRELDLEVEVAESYEETERLIQKYPERFFVAVLDLLLPDAPNGEVVSLVQKVGVPSIVLTASMSDESRNRFMEMELVDYVLKKSPNELLYISELINRLYENQYRTALIVGATIEQRSLLETALRNHYLTVDQVDSGQEGLEYLGRSRADLIITDSTLPDMEGAEFVLEVREKFTREELPIIAVSGPNSGLMSVNMIKSGANDYITSPFYLEEFYCRLNHNIDLSRKHKRICELTNVDTLTNLPNRKYILEEGNRQLKNAQRSGVHFILVMVSLDNFHEIQSEHGIPAGDRLLVHCGNILRQEVRESDLVARLGDDKFCIIGMSKSLDNLDNFFDRLEASFSNNTLEKNGQSIGLSVSIGYTTHLRNNIDSMVGDANDALYEARKRKLVAYCYGKVG